MQNRTRNKQLNLKFTEAEINYFKEKHRLSKIKNYTDFLLKAITNSRIYTVDTKPLLALANEVNKIGINVNQIAKAINTSGNVYKNEIEDLQRRITALEKCISDFMNNISTIKKS